MSYRIEGTRFIAPDVETWLRFEIAVERRELELLKKRCRPKTARAIREQAAQDVMDLFRAAAAERREPAE